MEEKRWKPVSDWQNLYEVSNHGEIRHIRRGTVKTLRKNNRGYLMVQFDDGKRKRTCSVHRLVAAAFVSNPGSKPNVNHKDENQENNYFENLEWNTQKENVLHSIKTGRSNPTRAGYLGHKKRWNYEK